jgi:hypothetical protein
MKVTMKIDRDVKADLEKVAGKIQSQEGGCVTLSDAVKFLIKFYRESLK